jgi:hypothetical protein
MCPWWRLVNAVGKPEGLVRAAAAAVWVFFTAKLRR